MIKFIKNGFLIGVLAIGLTACTSNKLTTANLNTQLEQKMAVPNSNSLSKQELSFVEKTKLLTAKMKQADFSFKAIDDIKIVEALSSDAVKSEKDKQCVFNNLDREIFHKDLEDSVEDLVNNDPQYVDLYLDKLDLLISINDIFYNHPAAIEFDEENLSASPAFTILPSSKATEFEAIILDERYLRLLSQIGQPANFNGEIFDFAKVKFFTLSLFIHESEIKCGLVV